MSTPALVIAGTELRRALRDRSLIITVVVGPIVLAAIISLALGSSSFEATIGVVDDDGSPLSSAFAAGLAGVDEDGLAFEAIDSVGAARRQVADGDVDAAIVVPSGFAASLAGTPAPLDVLTSSDAVIAGEVAQSVAGGFAARVDAGRLAAAATVLRGADAPSVDELAAIELPVTVDQRGTGDSVSPAAYFAPAMGLLFLFFAIGGIARSLLRERRTGVLDRMRVAPVTTTDILVGKAIFTFTAGLLGLLVIWAATHVALGADWGAPLGVVALIVAATLAITGIAGLIAAVAPTEQAADGLATGLALLFALVGGSFVPVEDLPDVFGALSLFSPNGLALRGFTELNSADASPVDVLPDVLALLAWAVVAGAVAARRLPHRLEAR
ncbi:MAG TPA: ABC transporter permease [Acidimicrobiales bacterium]|nr:ABC transporter permease [Acidimicrobiales bacterium]